MKYNWLIISFLLLAVTSFAQDYSWRAVPMDGSRTASSLVPEKCSAAHRVAEIIEQAQPAMARVKAVIGHSVAEFSKEYPESGLSNWTVDTIMDRVSELSGRKVDVGFANFGGIRVDMPSGDIMLDDILSMFPFRNNLVLLEHKGKTIREVIGKMASTSFQPIGGMKVTVEDGEVVSLTIGGEPLDDDKVYTVATNTFLLNGGDGLFLSKGAISEKIFDEQVVDAMLQDIRKLAEKGVSFDCKPDGRVIIR